MESRGTTENTEGTRGNTATELFIRSHAEDIVTNVDLDTLVPKLFNNNLLTPEEREELLYKREYPAHIRKEKLVTFLLRKGENALKLFVKSLHEATSYLSHAQLAGTLEHALQYLQQPSAANSGVSATTLEQSRPQLDLSATRERSFDSLESISAGKSV